MAKGLNQVNLVFTADTAQAKRAIHELTSSLNSIATGAAMGGGEMKITKEIHEAMNAAAELKVHLQNATNVNTGNLDFSKLSASLKRSGTTLDQYAAKLQSLGPAGSAAFMQLTQAVAKSEIPIRRSNTMLQQFATTLKNTARWQISSSLLHGFVGAVQSAYHYAQDLNQSLNNIRIVTGQSIDQMDQFAAKANKAAKALSTSTTSYTNAALIYYQQGLNDKQVEERTNTTIKMANVSRQSAEEVSSQMTAIWNNFDNGSKSLEYYGDVITALGAKTASSSSEIATGLEKFASVSKTIGLSYEYASAALATIVAQTRQSADTVGTALRTIFSRLEGLKLNEKLEDGTDLNKYSKALATVGVSIKDASGQLKDMDTILDDLGGKWQDLTKDQQVALAQTVGGVRQYTNLIALMDNWDTMKANINIAQTSEGTLQKQADIYAESWEAASKRVKATAESLYTTILNDEGFIKLTNGVAGAIEVIEKLVKMLGGVPGILAIIGSVATRVFQQEMIAHLQEAGERIKLLSPGYRKQLAQERDTAYSNMIERTKAGSDGFWASAGDKTNARYMERQLGIQREFMRRANYMSPEQQASAQRGLDRLDEMRQRAVKSSNTAEQTTMNLEDKRRASLGADYGKLSDEYSDLKELDKDYNKKLAELNALKKGTHGSEWKNKYGAEYDAIQEKQKINADQMTEVRNQLKPYQSQANAYEKLDAANMKYGQLDRLRTFSFATQKDAEGKTIMGKNGKAVIDVDSDAGKQKLEEFNKLLEQIKSENPEIKIDVDLTKSPEEIREQVDKAVETGQAEADKEIKDATKTLNGLGVNGEQAQEDSKRATKAKITAQNDELQGDLEADRQEKDLQKKGGKPGIAQQLTSVAQLATSTAAAIMSIKGAWDTVNNPDASGFEKVTAVLMALGTVIPVVISLFTALLPAGEAAGAGMTAAMGPVGWIILAFVALVAIIAIVVSSFDTLAAKQKRAAKAAEELAKAEEEAKQNAENLKAAIDKYDSAVAKLEQCVKGTQEWRDALKEVNEAAIEVLNSVQDDLTAEDYLALTESYKKTGKLDSNLLQKAQDSADKKVMQASTAKSLADYNLTQATIAMNADALAKTMANKTAWAQQTVVAAGDYYSTDYDQIRSRHKNKLDEVFANEDMMSQLAESLNVEEFAATLESFGVSLEGIDNNTISEWMASVQKMASEADAAAAKLSLLTKLQLDEYLGEGYTAAEKNFAASKQSAYKKEAYDSWLAFMKSDASQNLTMQVGENTYSGGINTWSGPENDVYQAVYARLLEAGYTNLSKVVSGQNAVLGDDKNRKLAFTITKDDGTTDRVEWDAEQIANKIAADEALQKATGDAQKARNLLGLFEGKGLDFVTDLATNYNDVTKQFDFSQYLEGLHQNDLEALMSGMGVDENGKLTVSQNVLDQLGLGSLEDFQTFIDAWDIDLSKFVNGFNGTVQDLNEGIATAGLDKVAKSLQKSENFQAVYNGSDLTVEQKKAFTQQVHDAFENGGEEAANSITDFYASIEDNDKRQAAIEALNSVADWSSMSLDDLKTTLNSFGVDITDLGDDAVAAGNKLQAVIDALKEIATLDFGTLAEGYKDAHKVIDKLTVGDAIEKDDLDKLKLSNDEISKFFTLLLDGTYQFIGDAKELKKVVEGKQTSNFEDLKTQNEQKIARLTALTVNDDLKNRLVQNAVGQEAIDTFNQQLELTPSQRAAIDRAVASGEDREIATQRSLDFNRQQATANFVANKEGTSEHAAVSEQLTYLQDFIPEMQAAGIERETYDNWLTAFAEGKLTPDDVTAIADAFTKIGIGSEGAADALAKAKAEQDDLNLAMDIAGKTTNEVNDLFTERIEKAKEAGATTEELAKIEDQRNKALYSAALTDAEKYDLDVEALENYTAQLMKTTGLEKGRAASLALDNMRMTKGIDKLTSGYENWAKVIKQGKTDKMVKNSEKWATSLKELNNTMKDITGSAQDFSEEFLTSEETMKLMEKAAKGDKDAIIELGVAAGKSQIGLDTLISSDNTAVANAATTLNSQLEQLMQDIKLDKIEVGAELDPGVASTFEQLLSMGQMTADQVNAALEAIGYDPEVTTETVTVDSSTVTSAGGYTTFTDVAGVTHTVPNEAFANIQGNQEIEVPVVKGTKKAGAGSGGGGGGGGGGGKKKHLQKKEPTEAKDRYHVVKNTLEEQQAQYQRIDTAYQRAFGKSKLDLLDKQIKKQKELIKTQQEYLDEAKEYLKYDKQQLELEARKQVYNEETNEYTTVDTSVAGLGMSIEWNETGGIDNIDAIMKANLDRYNAEVDRINEALDSGKMTQEEADWAQKVAEAQYQGLLDTINQYEETQDFVNEKLQDLIDAQNQYYDQLLEKTKLRVQLRVEVDEDSLNLINFLLERLEADAYKAAQRIDKLGESFAASADKMDAYKWGLIDLLANHGDENAEGTFAKLMAGEITPEQLLQQMQEGGNVFTQAEADAIREYMQNIMSEATEQLEIQKKVIEEIGTVLEENNRRLDRQIGKIEHLQNVMSSYKNIIDLSGRQFLGITSEIYDAMEEANVKLANDTLEADKARMDASNAWLQKIKEDYAAVYDTLTDEAKKAYEEQIEAAEDAAQEATEAYYSSWEAAIEAINTRFESAMQHMAEDFSKTMAGVAGNLEGVQQRMDLRKMVADVYVPEYEKMYQLTKLTREAQKSIDNASNVKVKQELLRVQQKIVEAQESGAKISQYELDYLQRELDLKAAQMALEEASKAKSQVRMTRDSEGNYAYVYTANEEAVEEAEQNYADKLYEMQKLNEEYVASLQDMLVELESNYIQALQDAAEMYGQGTEEYASAVADIQSQYGTYFDELMSEMGLVLSNNKETETIHAEIYKRLTGDVYQANVDLQTSWEETTLAGVTGYETLGQYQTAWAAASQKAYDDVIQANDIWMASMAEAYNLAGESIDTFAQTVGGDFEQIKEESQSLKEQMVEEDLPAMTEAINEVSKSVKSWQETYAEAIKAMLEDTEKMIAKYNELLAAWSKVDQKHQAAEQQGNANDANSSTGTQTNGNNSNNNNGNTKSSSSGSGGSSGSTGNQGGYGGGSGTSALIGGNNAIRNLTMLRFASGGYTGDWAGDEGKIAVLDRKELVLNAQDTFNILKAVDMIKSISQTIDINAMSAGGAFSNLISPFVSGTGDRLEQEVHITAEFPNVTNKNEILEAFDNVINLASQYANR